MLAFTSSHPSTPYLRVMAARARSVPSASSTLAVPSISPLRTLPRTSQTASVTRGVLRMRRTFHELVSVHTSSSPFSGAAHTAAGLARPSLV